MNKNLRKFLKNNKWIERLKKLFYSGRRHYNSTDTTDIEQDILGSSVPPMEAKSFEDFKNSKIGNKLKDTNTPYTEAKKKETKTQKKRTERRKDKQELKKVVEAELNADTEKVEYISETIATEQAEVKVAKKVNKAKKKSTTKKTKENKTETTKKTTTKDKTKKS